jgi:Flp pilus assembly protein TadD
VRDSAQKNQLLLAAVLLTVMTLAVYWQVMNNDFITVYDDASYVLKNEHVQKGLSLENVAWAFTATDVYNWHPLTWISHMLDYQLYGLKPRGHHATSLILHLAGSLLLLLVLARMTKSVWRSFFVAALFAVHPLHVESVAWIAERKDVLSTLFWMLTMGAYVLYTERPSVGRYLLVMVVFALGLMSKPMLVTLPLILLLMDYWPLGRFRLGEPSSKKKKRGKQPWPGRKLIWEKVPLLALTLGSSIATFVAQKHGGAMTSLDEFPLGVRIANAFVSYIGYIGKTFWPSKLAVLYLHPGAGLPTWEVLGSALLLLCVFVGVVRFGSRHPYLPVGWLWYFVTLIPVIGFIQVGRQAMANRYTYVPLIGLFIIIAWGIPDLWRRVREGETGRRGDKGTGGQGDPSIRPCGPLGAGTGTWALSVAAAIILAALMCAAYVQVGHWRDSISLFEYTASVTKGNHYVHGNLGWAYILKGKNSDAAEHFTKALRIKPDLFDMHYGLGNAYSYMGKVEKAIEQYSEALRLKPEFEPARDGLASALARGGKPRNNSVGTEQSEAAMQCFNQGVLAGQRGDTASAIRGYKKAIRLKPDFAEARCNLGVIYKNQGNLDAAIAEYRKAIEADPGLTQAYNNLAVIYYAKHDYAQAWKELNLAVEYGFTPNPDFVQALSEKMPEPRE